MKIENKKLEELLLEAFDNAIPPPIRPIWFDDYVNYLFFVQKHLNVLQLTVYFNKEIQTNESLFWQEQNGLRKLIRKNQETGEESVCIQYEHEMSIIFIGHLHKNLEVKIVQNMNANQLNEIDNSTLVPNSVKY